MNLGTNLADWIKAHDLLLDLWTLWLIVTGLAIWALVKVGSRLALRDTTDETGVGVELKREKVSEFLMGVAFTSLYSLTLWAYYEQEQITTWPKLALRLVLIVGVWAAAIFGLRFMVNLIHERRRNRPPSARQRTVIAWRSRDQLDRGIRQEARGQRQDRREARQDRREIALDERDVTP